MEDIKTRDIEESKQESIRRDRHITLSSGDLTQSHTCLLKLGLSNLRRKSERTATRPLNDRQALN